MISTTTHQAIAESAVDSDINMGAASQEGAEVESSADAALQPAPATFMGEASQEGGITHERGVTLQPSPAHMGDAAIRKDAGDNAFATLITSPTNIKE